MLSPHKEGDGKFFLLLSHPTITMEINARWSALIPQADQQQLAGPSAVGGAPPRLCPDPPRRLGLQAWRAEAKQLLLPDYNC